jgi:hypothetical protein
MAKMAKTEHYFTEFEAERFYHVYNRTVDGSVLSSSAIIVLIILRFK